MTRTGGDEVAEHEPDGGSVSAPTPARVPGLQTLLSASRKNWGRWGDDDEVGALNFLGRHEVVDSAELVRKGSVFTLQIPVGHPHGDPLFPGRVEAQRYNVRDKGHYLAGKVSPYPGGLEYADDFIAMFLQGSTHYDALGHAWIGDELWNGFDAQSTAGAMSRASVAPIAERGIVGRGVVLDIARYRNKESLERGETFTHDDLVACAETQGVELRPRDILLVHTGWLAKFYDSDPSGFFQQYVEPGLTYSAELVDWFYSMEIPNLVTDTLANEVTVDPRTGVVLPLHAALMRNLGVAFTEAAWLRDLAEDCFNDHCYECMYVAAPLKVCGATGSPVNPVVIK